MFYQSIGVSNLKINALEMEPGREEIILSSFGNVLVVSRKTIQNAISLSGIPNALIWIRAMYAEFVSKLCKNKGGIRFISSEYGDKYRIKIFLVSHISVSSLLPSCQYSSPNGVGCVIVIGLSIINVNSTDCTSVSGTSFC